MSRQRLAEARREARSRPSRGSGAALGEKVLRLSSFNTVGLFINHALTLVGAVVVAVFLGPADFGRYGLLLFAAAFLSFLFNLGSKQGTMKRTFGGGDDDDEDDDEEEGDLAESRQRALGTGLILTLVVSAVGTALFVLFADAVSGFLLAGQDDPELIVWAGVAGGFGAVVRLGSLALWMEERPAAYIFVETLRPALALLIAVPLLAAGAGVEAAIGSYAVASAATALAVLYLLRRSVELAFDLGESAAIMRRGAQRIPLVTSMWAVGYMDLFLLSRFVTQDQLGVYHLASKAGFAVAFLPAGYRKALRPIRKSPAFHAAEHEYSPGTARGIQLGYFLLMLVGVLLAITLFARALGRISPEGYGEAAALIPVLA
ncbi:MAG: oligosaccharide flippase family protein, partial [Thermoleophilia bacterium]|nr:oligosaccharide flippase family protein [Thermoleophilia bacterium]